MLGITTILASLFVFPTVAPAATNDGPYQVVQKYSNKCVDVRQNSDNPGAYVQQYDCNKTRAQRWTINLVAGTSDIYTFTAGTGYCLEDRSSFNFDGAPVDQAQCNPYAAQMQWKLIGPFQYGWYQIQNVLNPRCLDSEFSVDNGKILLLKDCGSPSYPGGGGWWNQQWQLTWL
jgi:hypothetical protein